MPVKPEVRTVLDAIEAMEVPLEQQTPEGMRQSYLALAMLETKDEVASVEDRTLPGPAGEVPIRIYRPASLDPNAPAPALVWFHGGGWVIGNLDTAEAVCRVLANGAEAVVVSVDYRLAPEHPFPAGLDDALAAVRWVASNAGELQIDSQRLAVGGDSAGSNLAAVLCQELKDSGPAICFQLLVYPATAVDLSMPSIDENADGYFLTKDTMIWFRGHYLGEGDPKNPRVSPLFADDDTFPGLPPALVITAEYDPLRDEGEAYGERLRKAGVDCEISRYDGVIHGFFAMRAFVPDARTAHDQATAALRTAFSS